MQLSVALVDKLDEPLSQLCNDGRGLAPSERVPVLVRCQREFMAAVAIEIKELGGTVRHNLALVGAIAAWIPLCSIERLAKDDKVRLLELEQSFTIA